MRVCARAVGKGARFWLAALAALAMFFWGEGEVGPTEREGDGGDWALHYGRHLFGLKKKDMPAGGGRGGVEVSAGRPRCGVMDQ